MMMMIFTGDNHSQMMPCVSQQWLFGYSFFLIDRNGVISFDFGWNARKSLNLNRNHRVSDAR